MEGLEEVAVGEDKVSGEEELPNLPPPLLFFLLQFLRVMNEI